MEMKKAQNRKEKQKSLTARTPFVRFKWRANLHVRCNILVLPAEVSGICYEHEDDQRCRNPYKHTVPF